MSIKGMIKMQQSNGKIVWGYIWRLMLYFLAASIVFGFIFKAILLLIYDDSMTNSIETQISYYKVYSIGAIIINILITILACKYATSSMKKAFILDENNVSQIYKYIIIVLVVLAVLMTIYYIFSMSDVKEQLEEYIAQINDFKSSYQQYSVDSLDESALELNNQIASLESFISFCNVYSVVAAIINIGVVLLMIPFEKKLLKV